METVSPLQKLCQMKQKTKFIGLLVLLVLSYNIIYASVEKLSVDVKWKWVETADANDSLSDKTIIVDSSQIAYLKMFLKDRFNYFDAESSLQAEIDSLQSSFSEFQLKAENGDYNNTYLWVRILSILSSVFLFLLIIYLIYRLSGLREEVIETVIGSNRVKALISKNYEQKDPSLPAKSYDGDIYDLQSENRVLKTRVAQLEDAIKLLGRNSLSIVEEPRVKEQPKTQIQLLYADNINEKGVFSHVTERPNDDTFFVLTSKSDSHASFTLYQPAYDKIIANPAFLEGCEKQIVGNTSVIVTDEGEAKKEGNGKWRVTSKVVVEIR